MDLSHEKNNDSKFSGNLRFFMLIGKLKELPRTGWVMKGIPNCESVASHMYRVSMMSFLLDRENKTLDRDKCIKMALVHDMAESIVGDITPHCGISKEEKHRREHEAMLTICSLIDEETKKELMELFEEYEMQQTPEAIAVKDLDRLDMILQAYEYETKTGKPSSLQGFFDSTEGSFSNNEISKWAQELRKVRQHELESKIKDSNQ